MNPEGARRVGEADRQTDNAHLTSTREVKPDSEDRGTDVRDRGWGRRGTWVTAYTLAAVRRFPGVWRTAR